MEIPCWKLEICLCTRKLLNELWTKIALDRNGYRILKEDCPRWNVYQVLGGSYHRHKLPSCVTGRNCLRRQLYVEQLKKVDVGRSCLVGERAYLECSKEYFWTKFVPDANY